jgi:hypothetical protein
MSEGDRPAAELSPDPWELFSDNEEMDPQLSKTRLV